MSIKPQLQILLLVFCTGTLCAQTFSIAELYANSSTHYEEESETLFSATSGSFSGRFVPVNQIRIKAGISLSIPDTINFFHALPAYSSQGTLLFNGASVSTPFIFGSDFSAALFTGLFDDPSSGSLLEELLKTTLDDPEFHGMPAGHYFSNETEIRGTGIALTAVPGTSGLVAGGYAYWNSSIGSDSSIRGDLRLGYAANLFSMNSFVGINWLHRQQEYAARGGLSVLFSQDDSHALYTSVGLKDFVPGESVPEDNIYFVFEPRISFEKSDLSLSFFSSPVETTGRTHLGANALFSIGKLKRDKMRAGISILGSFDSKNPGAVTPLSFSASPFYSMMFGDMVFETTAILKPLLFEHPASAFEIQLGMKAVY